MQHTISNLFDALTTGRLSARCLKCETEWAERSKETYHLPSRKAIERVRYD